MSLERAADEICRLTGRNVPISTLQRFRTALGVKKPAKRQRSRDPITVDIVRDWVTRFDAGEDLSSIAARWSRYSSVTVRSAIHRVVTDKPESEAECLVNQARIQARGQQNP